jgi:hypothetical protein
LLDIANDEIRKLEIGRLSASRKVDIDITRLLREGIEIDEVKDNKGKLFTLPEITFEKDILYQISMYYRGLVLKSTEKY